jgi:hypothetical protein
VIATGPPQILEGARHFLSATAERRRAEPDKFAALRYKFSVVQRNSSGVGERVSYRSDRIRRGDFLLTRTLQSTVGSTTIAGDADKILI